MDPQALKTNVLQYVDSMRCRDEGIGRYRYAGRHTRPVLYASTYAVLTRHLLGEMERVESSDRREWARYMQSFQDEEGLFKDPIIAHAGSWYVPPHMEWCGWLHLSCHVIMALTALGAPAEREFAFLKPFRDERSLREWLKKRDLGRIAFVGNEVLNVASLLQYERDFHSNRAAGRAVEMILDWLDAAQDPATGLWGNSFATPEEMSAAYQGAYHFYLLYFYDGREVRYSEHIIDSMLSMQTAAGGFGIVENTSGCADIDAIDPLVRLSFVTDHRRDDIRSALERACDWVLSNRTPNGAFAFIKDSEMFYGSKLMYAGTNEGSMFATWWRMLSLALIASVVTDHDIAAISWQFVRCPGCQFWNSEAQGSSASMAKA